MTDLLRCATPQLTNAENTGGGKSRASFGLFWVDVVRAVSRARVVASAGIKTATTTNERTSERGCNYEHCARARCASTSNRVNDSNQCSRKRVQQLQITKKVCFFLDFEKNGKNVKNVGLRRRTV